MCLDDAEMQELIREFVTVVQPGLANAPGPGRKGRILGTIPLPGTDADT